MYRGGVAEAETEFALFRPYLRGFRTPSKHSADVRSLERNPGLRPLGADLPWAIIGTPRWGFSFRLSAKVFFVIKFHEGLESYSGEVGTTVLRYSTFLVGYSLFYII